MATQDQILAGATEEALKAGEKPGSLAEGRGAPGIIRMARVVAPSAGGYIVDVLSTSGAVSFRLGGVSAPAGAVVSDQIVFITWLGRSPVPVIIGGSGGGGTGAGCGCNLLGVNWD